MKTKLNLRMLGAYAGIVTFVLFAGTGNASAQQRKSIKLPGMEAFPFSDGVVTGNTLYVAGQEGTVEGKLKPGGIAAETEAALDNIGKVRHCRPQRARW